MRAIQQLGYALCGALVVSSLNDCAQEDLSAGQVDTAALASDYARLHVGPPLTDQECQKFGESLQRAVKSGDVARINQLIDWDAFLYRAMLRIDIKETPRQTFIQSVKTNVNRRLSYQETLFASPRVH